MVDQIDPGQPFLRVNVLHRREILWMIETSSSDVDFIGAFVVEIIADNLKNAGWSLVCLSTVNRDGRIIWIVDAHRDGGMRFIARE